MLLMSLRIFSSRSEHCQIQSCLLKRLQRYNEQLFNANLKEAMVWIRSGYDQIGLLNPLFNHWLVAILHDFTFETSSCTMWLLAHAWVARCCAPERSVSGSRVNHQAFSGVEGGLGSLLGSRDFGLQKCSEHLLLATSNAYSTASPNVSHIICLIK